MAWLAHVTRRLSDGAAIALVAMMLLTIADILMKNLFHRPINGVFELVEFLMVVAVFFGLADVFLSQSNICVDVADHLVAGRARTAIALFGTLASLAFLLILGWAMLAPAWDTVVYPQDTQEIGIPLIAYWVPILAGVAVTIVATATVGWWQARGKTSGDAV
ncbi:MAG: TRAP transporter small permease subunit [Rhodopseudomonas sp.]|nr:TRAP transporter small permease subunit [Rhodopseudomonas sp.]